MIKPIIPQNEKERLLELYNLEILDTPYEEEFDEIVQLASKICNTPISTISLVDESRQWFKAKIGLEPTETAREVSFCAHTFSLDTDMLEVADTHQDERFYDNPLVTENPKIRFYAGVPLLSKKGYKLGTLCVIDSKPNNLNEEQSFALKVLARQISKMLELRIVHKQTEEQKQKIKAQNELQSKMLSIMAHDIRNPIGALKSAIEISQDETTSEAEKEALSQMFGGLLDSTLNMLDNLVDWGNIQMQSSEIKKEKVLLKNFVNSSFNDFQLNALMKNNQLINLVEEDFYIETDKNILKFILRNLIANANKFTEAGSITIYASHKNNSQIIYIKDTGVGISKENIQKLMSTNLKISTPGTQQEKGSGLGLALVKDFIQKINGTLAYESVEGSGTTAILTVKQ